MDVESDNYRRDRRVPPSRWELIEQSNCRLIFALVLGLFALLLTLIVQAITPSLDKTFLVGFWRAVSPWLSGCSTVVFLICAAVVCWNGYQVKLAHNEKVLKAALLEEKRKQERLTTRIMEQAYKNDDNIEIATHGEDRTIKVIRREVLLEQVRIQEAGKQARAIAGPRTTVTQEQEPGRVGAPGRSATAVDPRIVAQRKLIASIHVPTFGESLAAGVIGPGQKKILICHELETDEYSGELTGALRSYKDLLSNNCTMFLGGGSKSGKSTLMAYLGTQEALMSAVFYIIDPHLGHPEKSIAVKMAPLKHAFVLPPAQSDQEIRRMLDHMMHEADCRVHNIETPLSGRPIVVIIDEILNLFGRAQRNPEDKLVQDLYRDLAFFMRDLGTQYNKYDINGIFATQYLTKDAFRLPKGLNVDFRDACQNQTLLRLPPNQAAVMRLLQREELREMRALRQGFGFMGFATGDIIRMATGNITLEDIEQASYMVPAAPVVQKFYAGWSPETGGPGSVAGATIVESDTLKNGAGRSQDGENEPVDTAGGAPNERPARPYQMMSEVQAAAFRGMYPKIGSIDGTLDSIEGCNHRHRDHARLLIQQYGLTKEKRA